MAYNLLIAGAGQLGSRYLQGLAKFLPNSTIWVYDISEKSLKNSYERWRECKATQHKVYFLEDLSGIRGDLDVAFVTTTSKVRLDVVKEIKRYSTVKYWVLEKVLATSIQDLNLLIQETQYISKAWVNTPMYLWPLYDELQKHSDRSKPIFARFEGFRGLACNAIHYIDFVSRWSNSKVKLICTDRLNCEWVKSKRNGFMEVEGELNCTFSDGSLLSMRASEKAHDYKIKVETSRNVWQVNEDQGRIENELGKSFHAPILKQSELTAPLLKSILTTSACQLPTLSESVEQHVPLLNSLIEHWNRNMPYRTSSLPIT